MAESLRYCSAVQHSTVTDHRPQNGNLATKENKNKKTRKFQSKSKIRNENSVRLQTRLVIAMYLDDQLHYIGCCD